MTEDGFALSCPVPSGAARDRSSSPMAAAAGDGAAPRTVFRPAFADAELERRHDGARAAHGAGRSPSRPIPTWFARWSFPAATSARSPSTARSTTSPCAVRGRSISAPASSWRRASARLLRRDRRLYARGSRGAGVRIVTGESRSSIAARRTGCSSTLRASAASLRHAPIEPRERAARRRGDLSAAISAAMASLCWRRARGSASRPSIESDCAPLAGPCLR